MHIRERIRDGIVVRTQKCAEDDRPLPRHLGRCPAPADLPRLARMALASARIGQGQLGGVDAIQSTTPLGIERSQHPQVAQQAQPAPARIGPLALAGAVFFQGKEVRRLRGHQRIRAHGILSLDKVAQHGRQPSWAEHRLHAHQRGQGCCRIRRRPTRQQSRARALASSLVGVAARPALRQQSQPGDQDRQGAGRSPDECHLHHDPALP